MKRLKKDDTCWAKDISDFWDQFLHPFPFSRIQKHTKSISKQGVKGRKRD